MTTETADNDLYGDVMKHIRNAGEANLKLQQDMFRQWTNFVARVSQSAERLGSTKYEIFSTSGRTVSRN